MVRKPYPVAVRLCVILSQRWSEIDAAYYPGNILRERVPRLMGLVYAWCVERVDPDKLEDWLGELNDLLPWQDSTSAAAVDMESESFMNMMNKG